MRAKLSTTADGTYTGFAPPAPIPSDLFAPDAGPGGQAKAIPRKTGTNLHRQGLLRTGRSNPSTTSDLRGEGLLHDARNLVSAIGLYCDLLSMPGVLKPEHKQYPEELRLLGTRSRVLIEHLLRSLVAQNMSNRDEDARLLDQAFPKPDVPSGVSGQPAFRESDLAARPSPLSLRATTQRCSGLLSRVANGRSIEFVHGPAADVPVSISEEAIERILVNLVRNASQAIDRRPPLSGAAPAIRISVGPLLDRIGEARSWPFQHVRLIVEDFGCGMDQDQLRSLLSAHSTETQAGHGIGFRVVRELVAASNGDLCVASNPGAGTQVQIEWPVAATPTTEKDRAHMQRTFGLEQNLNPSPMELRDRPLPANSQSSTALAGRQGVN